MKKGKLVFLGLFIVITGICAFIAFRNDKVEEKELGTVEVEENDGRLKDVTVLEEEEWEAADKEAAEKASEFFKNASYSLDINDMSAIATVDSSFEAYCASEDAYIYYSLVNQLAEKYEVETTDVTIKSMDYEPETSQLPLQITVKDTVLKVYITDDNKAYVFTNVNAE